MSTSSRGLARGPSTRMRTRRETSSSGSRRPPDASERRWSRSVPPRHGLRARPDSPFDPREGRIDVRVEDDWVRAEGHDLGADNGIGVATALAVADDPALEHGSSSSSSRSRRSRGSTAPRRSDASLVTGRRLVNLDGTSDDALTIGCAGAITRSCACSSSRRHFRPMTSCSSSRSGARGGHSGEDIPAGRANAIKALGRVLAAAHDAAPFRLVSLDGGVSRNAIPRDARAVVCGRDRARDDASATQPGSSSPQSCVSTRARTTASCSTSLRRTTGRRPRSPDEDASRADLMSAIPTGVVAMTPGLDGSRRDEHEPDDGGTRRRPHARIDVAELERRGARRPRGTMQALARLGGAEIEVRRSYPPWSPTSTPPLPAARRRPRAHLRHDPRSRWSTAGSSAPSSAAAPGCRDDLDRAGDRRPARAGREAPHLEHAALLPPARRASWATSQQAACRRQRRSSVGASRRGRSADHGRARRRRAASSRSTRFTVRARCRPCLRCPPGSAARRRPRHRAELDETATHACLRIDVVRLDDSIRRAAKLLREEPQDILHPGCSR